MFSLIRHFDKLFNELWNEAFSSVKFTDLNELKEKGEVTEETETSGDFVTKKIHFKSSDGATEIYRSVTTNKNAEKFSRASELRSKINKLLREGNFEDAIPLRDELRELESELKKPSKQLTGKQ